MEAELAKLRLQLEKEQRLREEEQRRREDAEERLSTEQRRREEEQRLREEEQHLRAEEQRRREAAERVSQLQTLQQYLEGCHSLDTAIQVITDPSSTTQGNTTNPTGRVYPRRIVPSPDFITKQLEIWELLSASDSFHSDFLFPSVHQLSYVRSVLSPISSEMSLRQFEHDAVENAVQKLIDYVYNDPVLRDGLGLLGTVTFESHTNLGNPPTSLTESMEHMSISKSDARSRIPRGRPSGRQVRPNVKRKPPLADSFCIYRNSDGRNIPSLAIEYKAPHKLSVGEIVTGLELEIQPDRDVINKDGEGFAFASKSLAAAVITQLFSYMVGKGIQHGYICTGEAFVFLQIPDDPTIVYYTVCVPSQDVAADKETGLHRTAVAQIFAFILQALRAEPPPMSWHDDSAKLDAWVVEYDDVLKNIPPTVRKEKRTTSYKASNWKNRIRRSPILTRSRCKSPDRGYQANYDEDNGNDPYDPPSPSPNQAGRVSKAATTRGKRQGRGRANDQGRRKGGQAEKNIQKRPFCTQECLLGLARGGPLDGQCPNLPYHKRRHIDRQEFLRLIRAQLAKDRGADADCTPLYLSGAVGALFKVRLSSHGYTLVAKGVEASRVGRLRHENMLYDQLTTIQGKHVPVCLGIVYPDLPYYYDGRIFEYLMFLSWAGRPLHECISQDDKASVGQAITDAFRELHKLRVLHCDAEPRNILYNAEEKKVMIVDFERAKFQELHSRQPLASIGTNSRKRKRRVLQKPEHDSFIRELDHIAARVLKI